MLVRKTGQSKLLWTHVSSTGDRSNGKLGWTCFKQQVTHVTEADERATSMRVLVLDCVERQAVGG